MKKLLSLLSVLTVGTLATTNVVACSSHKSNLTPADQSKLPFLYHVAQVTNLGTIANKEEKTILDAFKTKNPSIKDSTLKVTNITDKTATINVDKYDTNFKQGTLNVTFNSIQGNDLTKLITVTSVYARHIGDDGPVISEQDVLDGINAMNGLNLTLKDVDITFPNQYPNTGLASKATISATKGSQYQGEIKEIKLNQNIDIAQLLSNTDIGNVYLPKVETTDVAFDFKKDPTYQLGITAFLLEYIGDANQLLANYQDLMISMQMTGTDGIITVSNNQLTLNADYIPPTYSNPLNGYFTGKVTFNYNVTSDNRLAIKDAIKITKLGKLKDTTKQSVSDSIKDAIIDKNQDQLKQFDQKEVKRYLVVSDIDSKNNTATISWLPGSKQFLGHNGAAAVVNQTLPGVTIPDLETTVNFSI